MDPRFRLARSFRPPSLLLAPLLLALACSSGKSARYDPSEPGQPAQVPESTLPPPPPLGPDQSQASATGCSQSASPSEQDAVAYPPLVPGSRAPSATEVQLGTQPAGVWVSNNLTHACCTKARVHVQRTEGQVSFFETVEGNACGDGCMCTSQIRAALGVPPGRYGVALRIEDAAGSTIVKQSSFVVEAY